MFFGRQFNEDLNQRTKPGETEPGLPPTARWSSQRRARFGRNFDVFFGVQNLFDEEYYVRLAPTTIGIAAADQRRHAGAILRSIAVDHAACASPRA